MFIEIKANKSSISKRKLSLGVGINDADYITQPTVSGKRLICPFYKKWKSMLVRCYSEKYQIEQPTYIGCSVCDEWMTFSNFRSWMITKDWEGMELDKDIINHGNKIYSPENCVFIPSNLNSLLCSHDNERGKYPQGVSWHNQHKKYQSQISVGGKKIHIGYYSTEKKSSDAYIVEKTKLILAFSESHPDKRVSDGLKIYADLLSNHKHNKH